MRCQFEGCDREARAKGYCSRCYQRMRALRRVEEREGKANASEVVDEVKAIIQNIMLPKLEVAYAMRRSSRNNNGNTLSGWIAETLLLDGNTVIKREILHDLDAWPIAMEAIGNALRP